ncbi:MAG: lysylphosphatidylglycerol synthase transmembrane domain-containing protein [Anaerolineales bacterium]
MTEPKRRRRSWTTWARWIGTLLSVGLLIWMLEQQDWDQLLSASRSVGPRALIIGLAFLFVRLLLNTARWYALLRVQPVRLGYLQAAKLTFAGLFASNFLPTTVGGDVLRLVGVLEASDDRIAGTTSIVVDRLIGMFGMLVFLPFGFPILSSWLSSSPLLGATGLFTGGRMRSALGSSWRRVRDAFSLWRENPSALVFAFVFNWMGIAAYLYGTWTVAAAMGIPASYWQVAGATALTYYLTLLPISVNGYGLRELGVVAVYTQVGATAPQAAALALITRGMMWAISLPGMLWLGPLIQSASTQLASIGSGPGDEAMR